MPDNQGKLVGVTGAGNPLLKQADLPPTWARLDDDWILGMHLSKGLVEENASRSEDYWQADERRCAYARLLRSWGLFC